MVDSLWSADANGERRPRTARRTLRSLVESATKQRKTGGLNDEGKAVSALGRRSGEAAAVVAVCVDRWMAVNVSMQCCDVRCDASHLEVATGEQQRRESLQRPPNAILPRSRSARVGAVVEGGGHGVGRRWEVGIPIMSTDGDRRSTNWIGLWVWPPSGSGFTASDLA
jgi:hypothetical protein